MNERADGCGGCGCLIAVMALNLFIGTSACDYLTKFWLGRDASFAVDAVVGTLGGEIVVPAAICTWVLDKSGVAKSKWPPRVRDTTISAP